MQNNNSVNALYRILYIDDEPPLLEVVKLYLERKRKFSVDTLTSASKALVHLKTEHYDAIICDYQMPGMDGIAFLKRLRSLGNDIPFIIFTGKGREEVVIQALNEGADFYLQKGGNPAAQFAELTNIIQKVVQHRRAEASIRDLERREADLINFLPDATFAIDTNGIVIAWNRAMEKMTGVLSSYITGKGDYEYALPFYRERRPILIDLVLKDDPVTETKYPYIKREADRLISEIFIPHLNDGRGSYLWFSASPLYNYQGIIIGAIESIRDITEWRRAEEAVHESEERFRALYEENPFMYFTIDLDGTVLSVNPYGAAELGYSVSELLGQAIFTVFHPDDRDAAMKQVAACLERLGEVLTWEIRKVKKDGTVIWVREVARAVRGGDDRPIVLIVCEDITEKKRMEEALQKSHDEYVHLLENITDVYYRSDMEGRLILASRSWAEYLGYDDLSECLGKNIADTFYADPGERTRFLEEVYRSGFVHDYEVTLKKKDGTPLPVATSSYLYFDESGNMLGVEGTWRDITERKRAEEEDKKTHEELAASYEQLAATDEELQQTLDQLTQHERNLQESEEKYRTIFENTGTATIFVEENNIISLANTEFAKLSGFSKEDIEGEKSWTEFVVKEDLERMLAQHRLRRQDREKALTHYEFRFVTKSGDIRNIYLTVDVIPGTKKSVASLMDITERKRTEELYQTVFENSGTAMIIIEEDTTISRVNDEMEKMWGYSREEIEGRVKWPTLVAKEDREKMLEYHRLRRTDPDSAPRNYEFGFIHKNGEFRNVALNAAMIPGTKKSVISLRDITEYKRVEQALRESEGKYRDTFEKSVLGLFRTTPDGRLINANDALARLYGYSGAAEMLAAGLDVGRQFYANPKDWNEVVHILAENGIVENYEILHLKQDGARFWVSITARAIHDTEGNALFYEGICIDITDRKRAEEDLRIQHNLALALTTCHTLKEALELLLDTALHGEGLDSGGIYLAHPVTGALDLVVHRGLLPGTIEHVSHFDADAPQVLRAKTGTPFYGRYADLRQPGKDEIRDREGVTALASIPVLHGSSIVAIMNMASHVHDDIPVHTRQLLETLAAQTGGALVYIRSEEALQQANKKLTLLSGITWHDMRNQLLVINGYLGMLQEDISDPAFEGHFTKIAEAISRISAMTQFAKEYEQIGVNIPVWQDCCTLVETASNEVQLGNVKVKNEITAGTEVFVDPLIGKVFYSLIDNAVRHGGKITTIRFTVEERDGDRVVVCEDDGDGVPAEEKERIFERGFGKNTGMGLFLSREILSITGTTIRETGEPGKGARFEITVPDGAYRGG